MWYLCFEDLCVSPRRVPDQDLLVSAEFEGSLTFL